MGRLHKRHNWKARQNVETTIDRSAERMIKVELDDVDAGSYDSNNPLVLPSKKRATKVKVINQPKIRKLSKKERKKLEKIIERKEKKAKRSELLEKLQTVQVTKQELQLFTSISDVHAGKLKRKVEVDDATDDQVKISTLCGRKRKKIDNDYVEEETQSSHDSSSDDDDDSSDDSDDAADDNASNITDGLEDDSKNETLEKTDVIDSQSEKNSDNVDVDQKDTATSSKKSAPNVKPTAAKCSNSKDSKPASYVPVNRSAKIQEQRLKLPILGEEQTIMETINDNPVTILCGETGCGKTTQIPQFLYEAGYTLDGFIIGVTEPRRVAAISMSKRVAEEMNLSSREVSYQIRYEGNVTTDTKIKFMTDGVLLKEVQKDFLLTKYKVIVIDEAHERSVYTDILIGLLSRIVPLRNKRGNPLKLIIMSATLRVEDFTENTQLFKVTPPVIKVDSRQFPVTIHFNKRTPLDDYLGEAYKKVCKIHQQLPEGGILVFVTGQQEVHTLCAKLKRTFPFNTGKQTMKPVMSKDIEDKQKVELPNIKLEDYSILPTDEQAELKVAENESESLFVSHDSSEELSSGDEADDLDTAPPGHSTTNKQPMYVLPLYSLLSSERQAKVFEPPPEGCRLCVIATNVAETSLTIPNIRYVVDTGKVKTKFYDKVTGVSAFRITWTSKSSANQRAGRAGRTGPGHCYRLYSSAVFNDSFDQFSPPEIVRRPVDDLVLQMKDMHIHKVVNFPFPTCPDVEALKAAEKLLVSLGALESPPVPKSLKEAKAVPSAKITPLGHVIACFPVSPRYGKMLSLAHQHQLLPYVIALVAALSVQEMFVENQHLVDAEDEKEEQKMLRLKALQMRKTWAGFGNSLLLGDLMVMLKAVGAWEYEGATPAFCDQYGLRYKAMIEIRKLRAQLTNTVNSVIPEADVVLDPQMKPPTDVQIKLLRQIILSGLGDHVARLMPDLPKDAENAKKLKNAYQSMQLDEPVFIHPASVLYKNKAEYVVYQNIEETSKLYMKGVTVVEAEWLPVFVASQCKFSAPANDPPPRYDKDSGTIVCHMTSTFGPHFWSLPSVELEYPEGIDRYKWFGRSFLEGLVCPKLKKYTSTLLTSPITMIKSWAKLQPRTELFVNALISEGVDDKMKLDNVWKKKPKFLLKAYCAWLPESLHESIKEMWPPGED